MNLVVSITLVFIAAVAISFKIGYAMGESDGHFKTMKHLFPPRKGE